VRYFRLREQTIAYIKPYDQDVTCQVEDIALPYAQYESSGTIEPWTMNYGEVRHGNNTSHSLVNRIHREHSFRCPASRKCLRHRLFDKVPAASRIESMRFAGDSTLVHAQISSRKLCNTTWSVATNFHSSARHTSTAYWYHSVFSSPFADPHSPLIGAGTPIGSTYLAVRRPFASGISTVNKVKVCHLHTRFGTYPHGAQRCERATLAGSIFLRAQSGKSFSARTSV
jgi:hypothetical protein